MSRRLSRNTAASIAALLSYGGVAGGLFYHGRTLQLGVFVGIVVGLIAARIADAAIVALGASLVGAFALPATGYWFLADRIGFSPLIPVLAVVTALAVRFAVGRDRRFAHGAIAMAFAMILVNLWVTTVSLDSISLDDPSIVADRAGSLFVQMYTDMPARFPVDDAQTHINVLRAMKSGTPYYKAYPQVMSSYTGVRPGELWNVRQPWLYWLWAILPGPGDGLIWALLVLSSFAVVATGVFVAQWLKPPFAIPAAALVAVPLLHSLVSRNAVMAESWAVCLVLLCLACYALALNSPRWRAWTVAAVAFAVLAALIRELAVLPLIVGLVAALLYRRRKFDIVAWSAGLLMYVAFYAVHAAIAIPMLSHAPNRIGAGGFWNLLEGIRFGNMLIGGQLWFPFAAVALGLVGAAMIPDKGLRLMVAVHVLVLMTTWLFLSNNPPASALPGEVVVNYWGKLVTPVLFMVSPAVLLLLPGMGRGQHQTLKAR